jgi:hypothetical protein
MQLRGYIKFHKSFVDCTRRLVVFCAPGSIMGRLYYCRLLLRLSFHKCSSFTCCACLSVIGRNAAYFTCRRLSFVTPQLEQCSLLLAASSHLCRSTQPPIVFEIGNLHSYHRQHGCLRSWYIPVAQRHIRSPVSSPTSFYICRS